MILGGLPSGNLFEPSGSYFNIATDGESAINMFKLVCKSPHIIYQWAISIAILHNQMGPVGALHRSRIGPGQA